MRAWVLIENSAFGPDAIKVMGQAFDEVWEDIAGNYGDALREAAQMRLANALLSIAKDNENLDVASLKNAAIEVMRRSE